MTVVLPGRNQLLRNGVRIQVAREYRRLLTAGVPAWAAVVLARRAPRHPRHHAEEPA